MSHSSCQVTYNTNSGKMAAIISEEAKGRILAMDEKWYSNNICRFEMGHVSKRKKKNGEFCNLGTKNMDWTEENSCDYWLPIESCGLSHTFLAFVSKKQQKSAYVAGDMFRLKSQENDFRRLVLKDF